MPQTTTPKLDAGDTFPGMTFNLVDGNTMTIPADLQANFTILLGYRGKW